MGFYERFLSLCRKKGVSPSAAAKSIGIGTANATYWKRGSIPGGDTLRKLAEYFGVTVDFLLDESQNQTLPRLTKKDERDIEKILAAAREQLENQEGLMFDGDPASPEAIESILSAMELGLQAAKMRNKEKYTPKNIVKNSDKK